jgi:hypothetical protein
MFTTTATAAATMHYNNNNNSNNVKKALNNVSSSNSNNSGFSKVAPVHRRRIVSNNRGRFITNQANNIKTVGAIASPADNATSPSMASMTAPKNLHGFELVKEEFVPEYNAKGFLFRHKKTGAELMSLSSDDENKSFGVTFRTPPQNSTGIPHILEHSVLCGSRKYPIKEPFVELIKGSLNTFLNAMTYPDRTCYPVASCNLADFYNLVDVY